MPEYDIIFGPLRFAVLQELKHKSNFYKDYSVHRKNMMGKWRFMVITQLLLIWFLGFEAITHSDYVDAFKTPPAGG